jgi:glycerol-3-phosphate dehydrogenase subunit B
MKDYSARQIAETVKTRWPRLRAVRVSFPGGSQGPELFLERASLALELPETREKLARIIHPHVKDAKAVGLPAVLGLYRPREVLADLRKRIGVPVFEIPTIPPATPGLRLKAAFEKGLLAKGVRSFLQHRVLEARPVDSGGFILGIGHQIPEQYIRTDGIILATGRFLGKGLHADRTRIRETVFGLPVFQPSGRNLWHRTNFLNPLGHSVNRSGLEIDEHFRPLGAGRRPAFAALFAAGSILAHQDWMRTKSGAGIAVSTAYASVEAFCRHSSHTVPCQPVSDEP